MKIGEQQQQKKSGYLKNAAQEVITKCANSP